MSRGTGRTGEAETEEDLPFLIPDGGWSCVTTPMVSVLVPPPGSGYPPLTPAEPGERADYLRTYPKTGIPAVRLRRLTPTEREWAGLDKPAHSESEG